MTQYAKTIGGRAIVSRLRGIFRPTRVGEMGREVKRAKRRTNLEVSGACNLAGVECIVLTLAAGSAGSLQVRADQVLLETAAGRTSCLSKECIAVHLGIVSKRPVSAGSMMLTANCSPSPHRPLIRVHSRFQSRLVRVSAFHPVQSLLRKDDSNSPTPIMLCVVSVVRRFR